MTENKYFQVRDDGTHIPTLCLLIIAGEEDQQLLRAGYGKDIPYWFLINLNTMETNYDPEQWKNGRTLRVAHRWMEMDWPNLKNGQVVDVEYILKERDTPKEPE